jgi:hypothetical protein
MRHKRQGTQLGAIDREVAEFFNVADRLLAAYGYLSIEVWDRDRRVYRAQKEPRSAPS